jgi:hypothetical protein
MREVNHQEYVFDIPPNPDFPSLTFSITTSDKHIATWLDAQIKDAARYRKMRDMALQHGGGLVAFLEMERLEFVSSVGDFDAAVDKAALD